ncbi:glycosyltransferase [Phreatobacter aquaticus]|uniref:Glycosyltransferase n=2 Tax=Phreatobacter aquaticus TaxID=2570229 RepID=A0A4D7QUB1_9HYPH|nr:glycosyltransferase [Phreatobacter aquaticus]
MPLSRRETPRPGYAAASPGLDVAAVRTVVVVPTYRRPAMLRETLDSLSGQVGHAGFAILVVENDVGGQAGLTVARQVLEAGLLAGIAEVEPAPGNVSAINAGFSTALAAFPNAQFFLMIDDDETATPSWLASMVAAAEMSGADIVGGPVIPRFRTEPAAAISRHPVFHPAFGQTGPVERIYGSGNCLIRRAVFERLGEPAFDSRFNLLGGGDTDFFQRAHSAGFRSFWNQEALVIETVPEDRTSRNWVIKRGMRIGAINRALDMKGVAGAAGRAKVIAKDMAILAISPLRAIRSFVTSGHLLIAIHPIVIAFGRVSSAFGSEPHQYGQDKPS